MPEINIQCPLLAENARSMKINEGPLLRIFLMPEKATQGRIMIALGSKAKIDGCQLHF